jgi:hypothetical protein
MPTPWIYTTLAQALVDWLVLPGATNAGGWSTADPLTVSNINTAIQNAEDRLSKEIDLPAWQRTNNLLNLTTGTPFMALPADFLSMNEIMVTIYDSATNESKILPLLERDQGFIREAFPSMSQLTWQAPRYYAFTGPATGQLPTQIMVGAVPDQNYGVTMDYFASVLSIVTAGTSWLGTYAPSALFYASLQEGYVYTKGESDMLNTVAQIAQNAIAGLRLLGEGKLRTDNFKAPTKAMVRG